LSFRELMIISGLILFVYLRANGYASDQVVQQDSSIIIDSWFSPDKGQHLLGSMMATVLISKIGHTQLNMGTHNAQISAATISFSIGLGKELVDGKSLHNQFSWKDLTADIIGITIGLVLAGIK